VSHEAAVVSTAKPPDAFYRNKQHKQKQSLTWNGLTLHSAFIARAAPYAYGHSVNLIPAVYWLSFNSCPLSEQINAESSRAEVLCHDRCQHSDARDILCVYYVLTRYRTFRDRIFLRPFQKDT
jgi:hypothetical protein